MGNPQTPASSQPQGSPDDSAKREAVHFYPGDKVLLYLVDGKVRLKAEAWGGPPVKEARGRGERMGREPTYSGVFVIDGIAPYKTNTWPRSKIPWGTPIRESRAKAGRIEYQEPSGKWRPLVIKGKDGELTANDLIGIYEFRYGLSNGFPKTWFLNDFGPKAIRYYRDRNKNRRRDANEPLEGEMIHTTDYNEAQSEHYEGKPSEVELDESHGCIHIRPIDRDIFIATDAFRQGMTLIIHRYDETVGSGKQDTSK
jgi:hypothetical protein